MHCWKQMHFAPYKSFFRKFKVGKIIWASVLTQYHVCHRPHFPLHCHLCLNLFSYRKCMKCGFKYSKSEIFPITTGNSLQSLAILVRVLLLNQEPKQCLISNLTERLWLCNQDSFLLFFYWNVTSQALTNLPSMMHFILPLEAWDCSGLVLFPMPPLQLLLVYYPIWKRGSRIMCGYQRQWEGDHLPVAALTGCYWSSFYLTMLELMFVISLLSLLNIQHPLLPLELVFSPSQAPFYFSEWVSA